MSKEKSNIIWRIFSSVKLTLALLIILAVTSILGTVIPQKEGALAFIRGLNPGIIRFFDSLQLFDMYHSTWFRFIIFCLAINLIVCSINRLPATLKRFRMHPRPDRSKPFKDLPPHRKITIKTAAKGIENSISRLLKTRYRKIETKETQNIIYLYGERGIYSLFGVYLVHLSVLLILLGAIIGSIAGFKGYVEIPEGEKRGTIVLRSSARDHKHKELGFDVRCDKFLMDYYHNGTVKEYRSKLTFLIDDHILKQGDLLVNHPITFRGIKFYQGRYGVIPGDQVRLIISNNDNKDQKRTLDVKKGEMIPIAQDGTRFQVVNIDPNLKDMMGPAARISVKSQDGKEFDFWIFKNIEILKKRFPAEMFKSPRLDPSSFKPYTFHLDGIQVRYKTGLEVNKDPGVPFVWTGFILIMVGLIITFFGSHRRIWIRMERDKDGTIVVSVAGMANKNPVGMENELDLLIDKVKDLSSSEGKF